jgi:hypothetical protein
VRGKKKNLEPYRLYTLIRAKRMKKEALVPHKTTIETSLTNPWKLYGS